MHSRKSAKSIEEKVPFVTVIELKDMFKPKKGRLISLSHEEQAEVSAFIDNQLKKGYI